EVSGAGTTPRTDRGGRRGEDRRPGAERFAARTLRGGSRGRLARGLHHRRPHAVAPECHRHRRRVPRRRAGQLSVYFRPLTGSDARILSIERPHPRLLWLYMIRAVLTGPGVVIMAPLLFF